MLSLFVAWAALALVSTAVGFDVLRRCGGLALGRAGDRVVLATWLGLIVLATLLLATALLVPLSPGVSLAVTGAATAIALSSRDSRTAWRESWVAAAESRPLGVALLAVGVGLLAAQPVTWYDTGLYHYGLIRWLQRYGEVPGLALIHMRFGQTSSWFALSAPLDAGAWQGRMTATLGGYALLVAFVHALIGGARILARVGRIHDWFAIFLLPIPFFLIRTAIAPSPSPDVPALLLTGLVAWSMVLISAEPADAVPGGASSPRLIPFVLSAGATAIKLSCLPLLVVSSFFLWRRALPGRRHLLVSAIVALAFFVPLMAAGLITSGCPLYPSPFGCLNVPWGVGEDQAAGYSLVIKEWAQWNRPTPTGAAPYDWLNPWVQANDRLAILLTTSMVAIPALWVLRRRIPGAAPVAGLAAFGIVFVMWTAPTDRFVIAYAVVPPGLFLARLGIRRWPRGHDRREAAHRLLSQFLILVSTGAFLLAVYSIHAGRRAVKLQAVIGITVKAELGLLVPPLLPGPRAVTRVEAGGFYYNTPTIAGGTDQCWATPQPCTSHLTLDGVSLRDVRQRFRGGFQSPKRY